MLTAFYDLALSPAKYDFVGFMMEAERFRRLTGENGIRFVFVPGPNHGFRLDKLPPQSIEHRLLMFNRILIPLCSMLEVGTEIVVCMAREEARDYQTGEIFPSNYTVDDPCRHYGMQVMARGFKRKEYPLRAVEAMAKQPDLVTITLRESSYWSTRNGNRETWLAAGEKIKAAGLRVVIVPDIDSPPVEGWEVDTEASFNLNRRAALYESAAHNFFVSNGPAWMAAAMKDPSCTIFKIVSQGAVSCSEKFFSQIGFPKGSQIGRDNHRIIWEDDTKEVVLPIVDETVKGILK